MNNKEELYKKIALSLRFKIAKYISTPQSPALTAKELGGHPAIRDIIKEAGYKNLNAFLYELDRRKLLDFIPQTVKTIKNGFVHWSFQYLPKPVANRAEGSRERQVRAILREGTPRFEDEQILFCDTEQKLLEKYFSSFVKLLEGKMPANTSLRIEFCELHTNFATNKPIRNVSTFFEKLWIKYLAYRLYIFRDFVS